MHVGACFCLVSPLDFQEQEKVPKWVPADPLDLGHGEEKEEEKN